MKSILILTLVAVFVTVAHTAPQSNNMAMQTAIGSLDSNRFKPNWNLQGQGGGNNGRNWNAGVNAGLGTKVWQSPNGRHDFGVGANYGQQFGRHHGHAWRSKPNIGVGAAYRFKL